MQVLGTTAIFALLVGIAVATAQESPAIQPAPAQAPKPAAPKISAPATVAAKTATIMSEPAKRESFTEAALSAGERLKIQSALLWSGDYTASIGGEDPLVSAIKNYQKRSKSKITGVLSSSERTNLLAAAQSHLYLIGTATADNYTLSVHDALPTCPLSR